MQITDVRAVQPHTPDSPDDWRTSMGQFLVAVDTDTGLTGYGVGGGGLAGIHVVRTVLRDLLLGQNPDAIESLWSRMYRATLPFGRKGLAIMAISGVDLALWDLRGKAEQQPVVALLGGEPGQPIPTYLTVWDNLPADVAGKHQGYKLHLGELDAPDFVERVSNRVADARRAIGNEHELMIDAWMQWDVETTLEIDAACASGDLAWIEEPLPIDDEAGYAKLSTECETPIAGGEHEFTSAAFSSLVDRKLHQVLQPDVCWCGGLTELVRIYQIGQQAGLRVCPHRGAEVWSLPAIAALDRQPLAESPRPWMTWVHGQPEIVDGFVRVGEAYGFGVEFDRSVFS